LIKDTDYIENEAPNSYVAAVMFLPSRCLATVAEKCVYSTYSAPPPRPPHNYDFVVETSLSHPRRIVLGVLQIGKAKDLPAPHTYTYQVSHKDWFQEFKADGEGVHRQQSDFISQFLFFHSLRKVV
jgi:hypothetical protein